MDNRNNKPSFNPQEFIDAIEPLKSSETQKRIDAALEIGKLALQAAETENGAMSLATFLETKNSDNELLDISRVILLHNQTIEQLETEKRRLKQFLEGANAGTWTWEIQTGIETFDERCANIGGYTSEELIPNIADTWDNLTHPDDLVMSNELLQECIYGEIDQYICELRIKHKDGNNWVWVEDRGKVIERDENGQALRMIGTSLDINDRKIAEEKLLESEKFIKDILNSIPDRVFWKDKNLVYLGCNSAFAHDAGFSNPEDLIGKDDYQMGWSDQAELYRADDFAVIESGVAKLLVEEPQTTPVGDTITLLTNKTPLIDNNGEIVGILGSYMDITKRKQSEEALLKSEEQYRQLFENMTEGIAVHKLIFDADGNAIDYIIEDVNNSFEAITGLSEEQVVGKKASQVYGVNPAPYLQQYSSVAKSGEAIHFETEYELMQRCFAISVTSIDSQHFSTVFEDITERKKMEEKLKEMATKDPLTQLLNKEVLRDELQKLMEDSGQKKPAAFLMFDLMGFGKINKEYGHAIGDNILIEFAKSLNNSFRQVRTQNSKKSSNTDVIASLAEKRDENIATRFGGDEFAVILNEFDPANNINLRDFVTEKSKQILLGIKNLLLSKGINGFGIYANITRIDPKLHKNFDDIVNAADPKLKHKNYPDRVEIIMQIDKNGNVSFWDEVHRCFIYD